MYKALHILFIISFTGFLCPGQTDSTLLHEDSTLIELTTIKGSIAPKSVGFNGSGKFFAQNMMYRHTITVYDRAFNLIHTIKDGVYLDDFGYDEYGHFNRGAPVEITFSHEGKYAWVSNYQMFGDSLTTPGCDKCFSRNKYDPGFVYKINTGNYNIEDVIKVGSVPKYICATPDNKYVLVSNWTSGDVSVIDTESNKEIKKIYVGRFPRGIAIDALSEHAYIAVMGSTQVTKINLSTFEVSKIKGVGRRPRHLCMSPDNRFLYASINNEGKVVRINLNSNKVDAACYTGSHPRSMALSKDGKYLYVVNYHSNKLSKVHCPTFELIEEHKTYSKPIGITVDTLNNNIWIACYSGRIQVLKDETYAVQDPMKFVRKPPNSEDEAIGFQSILAKIEAAELALMEKENMLASNNPPEPKQPTKPKSSISPKPKEAKPTKSTKNSKTTTAKKPPVKKPAIPKTEDVADKPESTPNKPLASARYHIIVGSFGVKSNALRMQQKYQKEGYDVVILKKSNGLNVVSIYQTVSEQEVNKKLPHIKSTVLKQAWVYDLES